MRSKLLSPTAPAGALWLMATLALCAAALATALPAVRALAGPPAPAAAAPAVPLPLAGGWTTFANGDRIHRLLRDGQLVWAATEGGGLVRWDRYTRAYRQYLAPQDGLASNDVYGLSKAPDGRLWLATGRALTVLDPASGAITNYSPANSPGMPARVVTAVKAAPDGSLWVGFGQEWDPVTVDPKTKAPGTFKKGGLARYNPATGAWDQEQHAEIKRAGGIGGDAAADEFKTIPSENVTDIELGSDGILWVATKPFYQSEMIECPPEDASCRTDHAWVLTGGGLAAKQDATWASWTPASTDMSCYSPTINDLAADVEGRMWVATGGRGLMLMKNGLRKTGCKNGAQPYYTRPVRDTPGPRGNYIWSVDVAPDGNVWIGHGQGHADGLGIGILDHNNTFDDSSAANQGQAWRFDDSWEFINLDDGPEESNQVITALDVRDPGPVLLGTQDNRQGDGAGLRAFDYDTRTWTPLRTADTGIPSNEVTSASWNPATGELWVSFLHKGLARWDGSVWRGWRAFGKGRAVTTVVLDVNRDKDRIPVDLADQAAFDAAFPYVPRYLRFGDDPTLYRLTRSGLTTVGTSKYLDVVPKLQQPVKKGTTVYNVERGPASDSAAKVCFGGDGTVWATGRETIWLGDSCPGAWGTECWLDGGLGKFDGSQWTVYDQHSPDDAGKTVPDQETQSCAVDKQGRVWVGTGNPRTSEGDGVAYLDPATGRWTSWRKTQGVSFAGNGVSDIDVDPETGDIWLAHHASQFCEPPPFGGSCALLRLGGGVSRWNGGKWDIWQKPGTALAAFGTNGELSSVLVDRGAGRVWAGGFDAKPKSFHWGQGIGLNAVLNWCPLDCTSGAWKSKVWTDDGDLVALALDDDGHVWAGTHRYGNGIVPPVAGIKVYDGKDWSTYTPENSGLPSNEITALAPAGEAMWVGTRTRGLGYYSPALRPTPTPPPPTASATPAEETPTSGPSPSATGTGTEAPTAAASATTAAPASATATETPLATSVGPAPWSLFLPFAYQKNSCRGCPTPVPPTALRRTATATASPTPRPASATPTGTEPASPTPSPSGTPTETSAVPATQTATASATATATRTAPPASATPTTEPTSPPADGAWRQYTEQVLPRVRLLSVTGLSNGTVFMVGEGGKGYVWDGSQITQLPLPSEKNLRRVVFATDSQGYIAADEGFLYETRNGGQSWRLANTGSLVDDWWGVDVIKDGDGYRGWLLGHTKGIRLRLDASGWNAPTIEDRNSTHDYTDVAVLGPGGAVATRGETSGARIMTYNGSQWSPGPATGPLYDLDLRGSGRGTAVGFRGNVWQLGTDGKWAKLGDQPVTIGEDLYAVSARANDDVWVGGGRTQLFHWDGDAWENATVRVPLTPAIRSIWIKPDGSEGWAVGDEGMVLRYQR